MIIIKMIQYCFWLIIVPTIVGKIILPKNEKSDIYSWALGNILQMGIFFLISIPLILLKEKFTTLLYLYILILILLLLISLKFNMKKINLKEINFKNNIYILKTNIQERWSKIKKDFKGELHNLKKVPIIKIIAIFIIVMQLFLKIKYANINNDDSSFVSLSTTMIYTDKMYLHDDNGIEQEKIVVRRALSPISAYYSVLSKLLNTHVTIVTHTVMPIIFIILAYIVYYYFGKKIFDNQESVYIFLILISMLNLYAFDVKGYNKYLLLYTWFGRAILAGIIIPFIWCISLDAMNKEKNNVLDWITMFMLVLAGCLCSQMAVPLLITSIVALSIISSIRDKKITYLFKGIITIIPCLIVGIIYLIIL